MKTNDYFSRILSVIAIIISLVVWYTADTHASDLRKKIVKYSVAGFTGRGDPALPGVQRVSSRPSKEGIPLAKTISVDIGNDGSLPVSGVTLSVLTEGTQDRLPKLIVVLSPVVDREVIEENNVLVVRLKNPLGPHEHILALVTFNSRVVEASPNSNFELKEAYVDSEVGAAALVASLREKPATFPDVP